MADRGNSVPAGQTPALSGIIDFPQVLRGLLWLTAGVMVYVLARPPGVAFLPAAVSLYPVFPDQLLGLTGPLPIFFHVGAMSYLTIGLLALDRRGALIACAGWAAFDVLFEIGQHQQVSAWLVARIPAWFDQTPILEFARGFFVRGTFDLLDVIAALAAAVCVYCLTEHKPPTRT